MSRSNPFANPYLPEERSGRPGSSGSSYLSFQSSPSSLSRSRRASFSMDPAIFQGLPSDVFRNTSSSAGDFDYLANFPSSGSSDFQWAGPLDGTGDFAFPSGSIGMEDSFGMSNERYDTRPSSYGSSSSIMSQPSASGSSASLRTAPFPMSGSLFSQPSMSMSRDLPDDFGSSTGFSGHPKRRRKLSQTSPPREDWPSTSQFTSSSAQATEWSLPEMPSLPPIPSVASSSLSSVVSSGRPLRSTSQRTRQNAAASTNTRAGETLPRSMPSMDNHSPSTSDPQTRRRRLSMLPSIGTPLPASEPSHTSAFNRGAPLTSSGAASDPPPAPIPASWRLPPADAAARKYLTNREPTVSARWGTVPPLHTFPPWAQNWIINGDKAVPLDRGRQDPQYMDTESTRRDFSLGSGSNFSIFTRRLSDARDPGRS